MRLTWWEREELLEHLRQRSDIWAQNEQNPDLWLRTVRLAGPSIESEGLEPEELRVEEQEKGACAFHFVPEQSSSHKLWTLNTYALEWSEEYVNAYAEHLLRHWTTYGQRCTVAKFLRETLHVPEDQVESAAIELEALDYIDESTGKVILDPELAEPEAQGLLYPDSAPPIFDVPDPLQIGVWLLSGGMGWVKLALEAGMLRIALSVRSKDVNGWQHPLTGHVRPKHGRIADVAEDLAGRGIAKLRSAADASAETTDAVEDSARLQLMQLLQEEANANGGETESNA